MPIRNEGAAREAVRLPPGAFIGLALLIAGRNWLERRRAARADAPAAPALVERAERTREGTQLRQRLIVGVRVEIEVCRGEVRRIASLAFASPTRRFESPGVCFTSSSSCWRRR